MRSRKTGIAAVAVMAALWLTIPLGAQPAAPRPDRHGNWFSNEGPVVGKQRPGRFQAGSLWRVVAPQGVVARVAADPRAKIARSFPRGTVLQADVGAGGADEVLLNARDRDGNPWMRVRTEGGSSLDCYVRAHRRCIEPVLKSP